MMKMKTTKTSIVEQKKIENESANP